MSHPSLQLVGICTSVNSQMLISPYRLQSVAIVIYLVAQIVPSSAGVFFTHVLVLFFFLILPHFLVPDHFPG